MAITPPSSIMICRRVCGTVEAPVAFGATGFAGRLVAGYLAGHATGGVFDHSGHGKVLTRSDGRQARRPLPHDGIELVAVDAIGIIAIGL